MRGLLLASVLSCIMLAVGNAHAKSAGKGLTGSYQGTISAVLKNAVIIDISPEKPNRIEVKVDGKTKITGGGKTGAIGDLYKGLIVSVTVKNNYATSIEVTGAPSSE